MAPRTKPGATNARTAKTSDSPAAKPQQQAAQAPAQPAQVKPASDPTPAGANTCGKVCPQTSPNPNSNQKKARTKAERDADIARYEQERRDALARGDKKAAQEADLKAAQVMDEPKTLGDIGQEAGGILGTIFDARMGKGRARTNPRNSGASPAPSPAPKPTATPAPPPANATPRTANGNGGGRSDGKPKRKPKRRCELVPYKELQCEEGQDAHHVVPDWILRLGKRAVAGQQIPGMPSLDDAPAICLEKGKGKPHNVAHKHTDKVAQRVGREGRATGTPGTIQLGQAKTISGRAIEKATGGPAKGGCSRKDIQEQLNEYFKAPDDAKVRAVKDARRVKDEIRNVLNGGKD